MAKGSKNSRAKSTRKKLTSTNEENKPKVSDDQRETREELSEEYELVENVEQQTESNAEEAMHADGPPPPPPSTNKVGGGGNNVGLETGVRDGAVHNKQPEPEEATALSTEVATETAESYIKDDSPVATGQDHHPETPVASIPSVGVAATPSGDIEKEETSVTMDFGEDDEHREASSDNDIGNNVNSSEQEEPSHSSDNGPDSSKLEETDTSDLSKGVAMVSSTPAPDDAAESVSNMSEEEDDEGWDLIKVVSMESLTRDPIICTTEGCDLPACVVYASTKDPKHRYYECLDCQEDDFGGWPETLSEMPVKYLSEEHMQAMSKHCSKRQKPRPMPDFLEALPSNPKMSTLTLVQDDVNCTHAQAMTPLPSSQTGKKKSKVAVGVTPSPHPALTKAISNPTKPSKAALTMHANWQKSADEAGGGKIVVHKPEAKKKIFDFLYDAFRPMTITQIYKSLKCEVPSAVLKSCLDDMAALNAPFEMSDDEDDEGSKQKHQTQTSRSDDPYVGSLLYKAGKSANSCLYYVDYSKTKNSGNIDPVESNELAANLASAQAEELAMKDTSQTTTAQADKLYKEPTNEEAAAQLSKEEPIMEELRNKVDEAQKLKVNEKHKKATQSAIDRMAMEWRKRARLCKEFLVNMEDLTEGAVSLKKCLKGDGQIYIESDDVVLKNAREYAKKKQAFSGSGGRTKIGNKRRKTGPSNDKGQKTANSNGSIADENFIGVSLTSQGTVQREYLGGD